MSITDTQSELIKVKAAEGVVTVYIGSIPVVVLTPKQASMLASKLQETALEVAKK